MPSHRDNCSLFSLDMFVLISVCNDLKKDASKIFAEPKVFMIISRAHNLPTL